MLVICGSFELNCQMKPQIIIINGPNLNLVGTREPHLYGVDAFEDFIPRLRQAYPQFELEYYQSNVEGELINKLQGVGFKYALILLNAGGYTHTSVAIGDAVAAISTPVYEVHISNVFARESYRHHSFITPHALGLVCGFGLQSYALALEHFLQLDLSTK